jgi:hypothetical protein
MAKPTLTFRDCVNTIATSTTALEPNRLAAKFMLLRYDRDQLLAARIERAWRRAPNKIWSTALDIHAKAVKGELLEQARTANGGAQ